MRDSYIQEAFNLVCSEAKQAEGFYVVLMECTSRYGGPEEGGWWAHDTIPVAYQYFHTEVAALAAKEAIERMAEELTQDARRQHGDYCLRTMEWLDARGLDADYLPEPDGPTEYYVYVGDGVPEGSMGPTHYE